MSIKSKFAKITTGIDNFITGGSVVRWFINSKIKEYGEVLEIKLDSKTKHARVKVLLKGESKPLEIIVDEYEITREAGKSSIRILKASSNRLWMDAALQNFIVDKEFNVPEKAVSYMEDFLG